MRPQAVRWTAIALVLVTVAAVVIGVTRQEPCNRPAPVYPAGSAADGAIAVIGDLQRTSLCELLLGREQNDEERSRLIAALAQERPSMVVLLGDLVSHGASCGEWAAFDELLAPVRNLDVPVLPVPGNHDYQAGGKSALANFCARFPQTAESHWQRRRHGQLGLIWLDSNQKQLRAAQWNNQRQWFERELRAMDADPKIRGVLVFTHHPPYTNSTRTEDEQHVQKAFVRPFVAAKKTLALVSGHAHGYEHFVDHRKHFVVSGGGGGPRVRHLTAKSSRHVDHYQGPTPRPFHYLLATQTDGGSVLVARGFGKGETTAREIDRIDLPFP